MCVVLDGSFVLFFGNLLKLHLDRKVTYGLFRDGID